MLMLKEREETSSPKSEIKIFLFESSSKKTKMGDFKMNQKRIN